MPKASTQRNAKAYFDGFLTFMHESHPGVIDHRLVTEAMAAQWISWLQEKGYPVVTIEKYVATLRAAFNRANRISGWTRNPFREVGLPAPDSTVAHRAPFAKDETDRILDAAAQDPVIGGPVIVIGPPEPALKMIVGLRTTMVGSA